MLNTITASPSLAIRVSAEKLWMFNSLLQAGIHVQSESETSIGVFLKQLPGFSEDYITEQIQTIFLNGTATDDLATPLVGEAPVLAISAAMPGLAGAIFRKNSLHAALRTTKGPENTTFNKQQITVCLKLFNTIARDRGEEMLRLGVLIDSSAIQQFFSSRSSTLQHITSITLNNESITEPEMLSLLEQYDRLNIQVV